METLKAHEIINLIEAHLAELDKYKKAIKNQKELISNNYGDKIPVKSKKDLDGFRKHYNVTWDNLQQFVNKLNSIPVFITDDMIFEIASDIEDKEPGEYIYRFGTLDIAVDYDYSEMGYREVSTCAYIMTYFSADCDITVMFNGGEAVTAERLVEIETRLENEIKNLKL